MQQTDSGILSNTEVCPLNSAHEGVRMLKIRSDQTAHFALAALDGFVHRAVSHLRTELPDRVKAVNDRQLDAWVRDVIRVASRTLLELRSRFCVF